MVNGYSLLNVSQNYNTLKYKTITNSNNRLNNDIILISANINDNGKYTNVGNAWNSLRNGYYYM